MEPLIPTDDVKHHIYLIRGHRVMLDVDLATLYEVATKSLNRAVKRNITRFPADFMFQLTDVEIGNLRYQFGTSSWGGRRHHPYVFTEQGVAMLSSVLRSERAIQVNVAIMRAFVQLRGLISAHKDLALKLEELEGRIKDHDGRIEQVYEAIKRLMAGPDKPEPKIGFKAD